MLAHMDTGRLLVRAGVDQSLVHIFVLLLGVMKESEMPGVPKKSQSMDLTLLVLVVYKHY